MRKIHMVMALSLFMSGGISFAQLTGSNKSNFEKEYIPACIENQQKSNSGRGYSAADIGMFCKCMSSYISERATVEDINKTSEKLKKILFDGGLSCAYNHVKAK